MHHFKRVAAAVDVRPYLEELNRFSGSWDYVRARNIKVQRETANIWLRRAVPQIGVHVNDTHESAPSKEAASFPKLMKFLEQFAAEKRGQLSRAMIVDLKPHSKVYPHIDYGSYYRPRNRYHFVMVSAGGSAMRIENEVTLFHPGEIWWYDNQGLHSSRNDSEYHRIHVIFDVLPRSSLGRMTRLFWMWTVVFRRTWYYVSAWIRNLFGKSPRFSLEYLHLLRAYSYSPHARQHGDWLK